MRKLFFSLLILGFSVNATAATINIVKKDTVEKIDAIRFDLCSNGKMAYSAIASAKDSQSACSEKKYVDHKLPVTNFRNGEVSTVKAGAIEIKSSNQDFAEVLYERIMYMVSDQPAFEKRLIGIAVQNKDLGEENDITKQAIIYLFKEGSLTPENRAFNE